MVPVVFSYQADVSTTYKDTIKKRNLFDVIIGNADLFVLLVWDHI